MKKQRPQGRCSLCWLWICDILYSIRLNPGWKVYKADALIKPGAADDKYRVSSMDEKRLEAFEKMLKAITLQYDSTVEKMAKLKAEGKEKTVTYRQLFANKLQYQTILSYYRTYGLLGEDKENGGYKAF